MKLAEIINIIQGLIDKINARTGATDTTLAEAVARVTSGNMVDTSDGTATGSDMASNKIAYVKGERVAGKLDVYSNPSFQYKEIKDYPSSNCIYAVGQNDKRRILSQTGVVQVIVPYQEFGDATEDDVASGKTFTGASGLKKTGTAEMFKKKTGTVEIAGDASTIKIETGLNTIDAIIVYKTSSSNSTFFWVYSNIVKALACANSSSKLFSTSTTFYTNGGTITCNSNLSDYPIKAGTYKWVAYGS